MKQGLECLYKATGSQDTSNKSICFFSLSAVLVSHVEHKLMRHLASSWLANSNTKQAARWRDGRRPGVAAQMFAAGGANSGFACFGLTVGKVMSSASNVWTSWGPMSRRSQR